MKRLACLLVAAALTASSALFAQRPGVTLFEGARLVAGDGRPPLENSAFVVQNGAFTAIGRKGAVRAPAGATRVDLTG